MRPCVFLDRDGTINEEIGYLHDVEKLSLISGAAQAIRRLNVSGWPVVCVSNQSGVARGLFSIDSVYEVNQKLKELLAANGAYLDGIYFCPHHPTEGQYPYRLNCECRKPGSGMLKKAADELTIDLERSFLIGDRLSDIQTAQNAGLKSILVLTGYGHTELENIKDKIDLQPDYICKDISAAVDLILKQ
ncbi:MAG: D-glycero-beta-D-manno-heptose 1,7-bisphosphate 7-phosphatase [bacterium]